jgi:hypothetical protein
MRAPPPRVLCVPLLLLASCAQDYDVIPKPVDVDPGDVTECGFTRVDDTAFYRYDCNPVFSTTGEDWADTIYGTTFLVTDVLDHPFYQLWYTGGSASGSDGFGLGYAVSAEGTDWQPYPDNPLLAEPDDATAWDADAMDGMVVVWDPNTDQYVMLYQGINFDRSDWGLGVATSPDGHTWKRIKANPVYDLSHGVGSVVQWCWPLTLTLGDVAGYTGYVAGATRSGHCEMYRINGASASDWTPDSDLVMPVGNAGAWDDEGFASVAIADLAGTRHMFYVGFGDWEDHGTYQSGLHAFVGQATNEDGDWVRDPDIVPINMTDGGEVSAIAARTVGSRIHLWVTDNYDGVSAVGYFLYDPDAAAAEDAGGTAE